MNDPNWPAVVTWPSVGAGRLDGHRDTEPQPLNVRTIRELSGWRVIHDDVSPAFYHCQSSLNPFRLASERTCFDNSTLTNKPAAQVGRPGVSSMEDEHGSLIEQTQNG